MRPEQNSSPRSATVTGSRTRRRAFAIAAGFVLANGAGGGSGIYPAATACASIGSRPIKVSAA